MKSENKIKSILVSEWNINDEETINQYYVAVVRLYDELDRLWALEEDPECLQDDIRHNYLTVHDGMGQYKTSRTAYDPEEKWLWYLDETKCKAISLATSEIMDEDDLSMEFTADSIIPRFTLYVEKRAPGNYHAHVSEPDDPTRPWMSNLLNSCRATGKTSRAVVSYILRHIRTEFAGRYHREIRIPKTNYDVVEHQLY